MQTTVNFYDIRILQEKSSTDEPLMTIVHALMKSLLKSTTNLSTYPPDHKDKLPIITRTNSMLPKLMDTKFIHRYPETLTTVQQELI